MSLNAWTYAGNNQDRASTDSGRQHALSGDAVCDDELGKGILDKMDGATLMVEFGRSGEAKQIKQLAAQNVFAVTNRPAPAPASKSGRCGRGMSNIGSFFGSGSGPAKQKASSSTTPSKGRGSKPFVRGRGRGRAGAASPSGEAASPNAAGEAASPNADSSAAFRTPEAQGTKRPAGFDIGAEHADGALPPPPLPTLLPPALSPPDAIVSGALGVHYIPAGTRPHPLPPPLARPHACPTSLGADEEEEEGGDSSECRKRAKGGSVGKKEMSEEELAQYRRSKYTEKQEPSAQQRLKASHPWLSSNVTIGFHCAVCLRSLVKCSDKLSTTGYGVEDNGELTPIPTPQKLRIHEGKAQHQLNMEKAQKAKAAGQPSTARGSMKPLLTITSEKELCTP